MSSTGHTAFDAVRGFGPQMHIHGLRLILSSQDSQVLLLRGTLNLSSTLPVFVLGDGIINLANNMF